MRRPQLRTAVAFTVQTVILMVALSVVPSAHADTVLAPDPHVRAGGAARGALAPGAPSNSGDDRIGLPTPVKPPRSPRIPPLWNPFDGPGLTGALMQTWIDAQGAWQLAASRVHAQ